MKRCAWAAKDQLITKYHDEEWGVPAHDETRLFEFLTLEGMQAGLSWLIVLRKRENIRKALTFFNPEKIAQYSDQDVKRLMADRGIIRNRLKIKASVTNARCFLSVQDEFGSFDDYIWKFTNYQTLRHRCKSL